MEQKHRFFSLENPALLLLACIVLFILLIPLAPLACLFIFCLRTGLIKLDEIERAAIGEI